MRRNQAVESQGIGVGTKSLDTNNIPKVSLSRPDTKGKCPCVAGPECLRYTKRPGCEWSAEQHQLPIFKLSKSERDKVMAAARRIKEPAAALLTAVAAYNEAVSELRELVRGIDANWQAAWDKRSERWQESAAGQSVAEAITAWDALVDDLEDIEVELPDIKLPEAG